jgi:putative phosphotransacetylase
MTNEELDRLAALIAAELKRVGPADPDRHGERPGTWLRPPVRPEHARSAEALPPWSGAAQLLGDVAPGARAPSTSAHRDDAGQAAAAIRAAAAGAAPARTRTRPGTPAPGGSIAPRSAARGGSIEVPIGVSNRHVHLAEADARALFGTVQLTSHRALSQPGQFSAEQRVTAIGPKGRIEGIRVVGPARGATQLEIAASDAAILGVKPPVANSGRLEQSLGGVTLEGTRGSVRLERGVIVAARHLHLSPEDGARWRLKDGDLITARCGEGAREATWHGILVRCGPSHATELHLDADEARAAGVVTGARARIVGHAPAVAVRRRLLTERDVIALAARGERLPAHALLTPSARDRARALGLDPAP